MSFWTTLPKPIIALAPMAGVCDSPFRQICRIHGADVIYTEFLSADALVYKNAKTLEMLKFSPTEQPVVCQIFGKNPKTIAAAAKVVEAEGYSGIDLNFGCPAYKVVKTGGGVSLMRNLNKVYDVIAATQAAVTIPVSIKIRARIGRHAMIRDLIEERDQEDNRLETAGEVTALDLMKKIAGLKVPAIMLHARSYEQPFDGVPDLDMVKQVRQIYPGILLANGGIYTPEEAKRQLDATGADGVGLGRGVHGNPWLFQQIKDYGRVISSLGFNNISTTNPYLPSGYQPPQTGRGERSPGYMQPTWNDIKTTMLAHARLALELKGEKSLIELRKHLAWYCKGLTGAKELRSQLVRINTITELEQALSFRP